MNETKISRTMADAVKAYKTEKVEYAKAEAAHKAEQEAELLAWLDKAGLTPRGIDGNVITFEYEGQEVYFRIWQEDYGKWIKRISMCPDCGEEISSYEVAAGTLANWGKLLVEPLWTGHHYCGAKQTAETAERRLISALRELLMDSE